jgi:hypothetical protein
MPLILRRATTLLMCVFCAWFAWSRCSPTWCCRRGSTARLRESRHLPCSHRATTPSSRTPSRSMRAALCWSILWSLTRYSGFHRSSCLTGVGGQTLVNIICWGLTSWTTPLKTQCSLEIMHHVCLVVCQALERRLPSPMGRQSLGCLRWLTECDLVISNNLEK